MKRILTLSSLLITALTITSCATSTEQEKTEAVELTVVNESSTNSDNEELAGDDQTSILSSSDNAEWDQMLNEYEEYVDSYIRYYKKAMKGDMSALHSYSELLEKAEGLQESIEKAQSSNQLSMKQITRMSEIQTKMLQGMQ